jgi:hypothetical protein
VVAEDDEKVKEKEKGDGVDEEVYNKAGCLCRKEKMPSYNPRIVCCHCNSHRVPGSHNRRQ